jgi:hypothetical protein
MPQHNCIHCMWLWASSPHPKWANCSRPLRFSERDAEASAGERKPEPRGNRGRTQASRTNAHHAIKSDRSPCSSWCILSPDSQAPRLGNSVTRRQRKVLAFIASNLSPFLSYGKALFVKVVQPDPMYQECLHLPNHASLIDLLSQRHGVQIMEAERIPTPTHLPKAVPRESIPEPLVAVRQMFPQPPREAPISAQSNVIRPVVPVQDVYPALVEEVTYLEGAWAGQATAPPKEGELRHLVPPAAALRSPVNLLGSPEEAVRLDEHGASIAAPEALSDVGPATLLAQPSRQRRPIPHCSPVRTHESRRPANIGPHGADAGRVVAKQPTDDAPVAALIESRLLLARVIGDAAPQPNASKADSKAHKCGFRTVGGLAWRSIAPSGWRVTNVDSPAIATIQIHESYSVGMGESFRVAPSRGRRTRPFQPLGCRFCADRAPISCSVRRSV